MSFAAPCVAVPTPLALAWPMQGVATCRCSDHRRASGCGRRRGQHSRVITVLHTAIAGFRGVATYDATAGHLARNGIWRTRCYAGRSMSPTTAWLKTLVRRYVPLLSVSSASACGVASKPTDRMLAVNMATELQMSEWRQVARLAGLGQFRAARDRLQ